MNEEIKEIECSFIPDKQSIYTTSEELKLGRYSGSIYPFENFGLKKWVIHAYLKVDYERLVNEGMSKKRIIDGCLKFLNKLPERKKYQKKEPKPEFGNLEPLVSRIDGDYDCHYKEGKMIVTLVTDDRFNPNFWGEGFSP